MHLVRDTWNKEGYVYHKGKFMTSNWNQRFLKIDTDTLSLEYFEVDDTDIAKGVIGLKSCKVVLVKKQRKGKPGFNVDDGDRAHRFSVTTLEEAKDWVKYIQYIIYDLSDENLWRDMGDHNDKSMSRWVLDPSMKRQVIVTTDKKPNEVLLHFKLVSRSLRPKDIGLCPTDRLFIYMPIFLQNPKYIDYLYELMNISEEAAMLGIICKNADLNMANIYKESEEFWDFPFSERVEKTMAWYQEQSQHFPLEEGMEWDNLEMADMVYREQSPVTKLRVVKVFASGHKPCLIEQTYEDPEIEPSLVVFKDDDLRPDMMVESMFHIFNYIWQKSGLSINPELLTFNVVPGGLNFGLMEFVSNSKSVRDFNFNDMDDYDEYERDTFLSTAAGGFIGAFLLGIRDRHKDNLMIKDNHQFFQLDFKHAFNLKTFGVDSCRFAIPTMMKAKLESWNAWDNFKNRCVAAHMVLRRHAGVIVFIARNLFSEIFNDELIEQELLRAFYLDRTEEQAALQIKNLIESGVTSIKRLLKNTTHELSGNVK
eukprot:TRINITY_DN5939_c0_g1_i1.p1 TRINITY_DN5939_c0_g1~~TRINITY_DN5939_c0_g1_i1.p1  ORF type:complete len:557 (-),score=95.41 TRINITY_DN5939_c0_g1_i1:39-1646(-)